MNKVGKLSIIIFISCFFHTAHADPLVDTFTDEFFSELSIMYGFNRLRAPEGDAMIGHAFYIEQSDVKCSGDLPKLARTGSKVQATKIIDLEKTAGMKRLPSTNNWSSILISSLITKNVESRISTKFPDRSADVKAAAESFRLTKAQIFFASRSVPGLIYKRAAEKQLKTMGIISSSDIEAGAVGVVVPVADLVVQKFEYDTETLMSSDLGFTSTFLNLFGLRVAGEQSDHLQAGYKIATNSVLAFKPMTLLFDCK